jgi:NDP-sugar pyrophosphorylase family protein
MPKDKYNRDEVRITGEDKKMVKSCEITKCKNFILDDEGKVTEYIEVRAGGIVRNDLIIGQKSVIHMDLILREHSNVGRNVEVGAYSKIYGFLELQKYSEIGNNLNIHVGSYIGKLITSKKAVIKGDFYIAGEIRDFDGELPKARRYIVDKKEAKLPGNLLGDLEEVGYIPAVVS